MKKLSSTILMGLFILTMTVTFLVMNLTKPRILVVHSYDAEYSWVRDINIGLNRILQDRPYFVRWHYMDTKHHPDKSFKQKAGIAARKAIDEWKPTIVIAVDDDAQEYAAKYYAGRPDIKIVFAGINGEIGPYGYVNAKNVTGILERKQMNAVKEVILEVSHMRGSKEQQRIFNIGDTSGSVKEDTEHIERFDWWPIKFVASRLVLTFDDWKRAVAEANTSADFILTTNYRAVQRSATDKTRVPPKELVKWTEENSKIPLIGTNGFYVEDGGMFAVATSPYEQGEVAGKMAVQMLDKQKAPNQIAVESTQQFIIYKRESALKKHDFPLPDVYDSFARSTNNYFP